ncbi:MAG: TauD/TfdA family dioxygenase [Gammaproteobacteria bacterium]|nr:TauD/TfdA family dioxygenase [Gammaproteobacteria bacterium]
MHRLAPALGAEVTGPRLADLDDAGIAALHRLLVEHSVLFLPGQDPTIDEHVALGERMAGSVGGELEGHPNLKYEAPHPKIFELRASGGGIADEWHTDLTFQERPALMSILHMVRCPEVGGDTMWTDLCRRVRRTVGADEGPLRRPHGTCTTPCPTIARTGWRSSRWSGFIRRPGRRALYVNEHFTRRIVEMNAEESDMLLRHLTKWVQQPRFTVRVSLDRGHRGPVGQPRYPALRPQRLRGRAR